MATGLAHGLSHLVNIPVTQMSSFEVSKLEWSFKNLKSTRSIVRILNLQLVTLDLTVKSPKVGLIHVP